MSFARSVPPAAALALLLSGSAQAQGRHHHEKHEDPAEQKPKVDQQAPVQTASHGDDLMAPKGPSRVDFDDRLLQGQTNRLGAVYLYQRKDPVLPSLLDRRKSFRPEIKRDVLE